jgi:hypothetical protein
MRTNFKNKKNAILGLAFISVSAISLGIFMQSCSTEDFDLNNKSVLDHKAAYEITYQYLSYSEGQFKLLLSKEDANELGVSDAFYEEMLAYIENANKEVLKIVRENPDIKFFDPSSMPRHINYSSPRLKTGSETWNYQGSGSLNGQTPSSCTLTVPAGYTSVRVSVYSNAIIGLGNVTMNSSYGSQSMGTYNILFWNGAAQFSLPVNSGMNITITVRVASSEGGSYSVHYGY